MLAIAASGHSGIIERKRDEAYGGSCLVVRYVGTACVLAFSLLLIVSASAASQGPIPLVAPFGHFALRDPTEPAPPGPPRFYAETGRDPGWQIAQWNIPGGRLSPFSSSTSGGVETLTSTSPEATVQIVRGARGETIKLSQDGSVLPCTTSRGTPRESDLLFGPKDRSAPGANALTSPPVPLDQLRSLTVVAGVSIASGMTRGPKGCTVNQGAALVAIVLTNPSRTPPQTLFYQIALNLPCGPGPAVHVKQCVAGTAKPYFFFIHNPFGVQDYLGSLSGNFLTQSEARTITINVLPRITSLIGSGPNGMDRDPSHWAVQNFYAGQAIWGDATLSSTWDQFAVLAQNR